MLLEGFVSGWQAEGAGFGWDKGSVGLCPAFVSPAAALGLGLNACHGASLQRGGWGGGGIQVLAVIPLSVFSSLRWSGCGREEGAVRKGWFK